jgi:hypothetical protein
LPRWIINDNIAKATQTKAFAEAAKAEHGCKDKTRGAPLDRIASTADTSSAFGYYRQVFGSRSRAAFSGMCLIIFSLFIDFYIDNFLSF